MSGWVQPLDFIALRLADEGVPLRAIARACGLSSENIRVTLEQARANGQLIDLPCNDWPIGVTRAKRPQGVKRGRFKRLRLAFEHRALAQAAAQYLFDITPIQAHYLLLLIFQPGIFRASLDKSPKNVDVQMWRLRKKIEPFGLKIETIWASGYRMELAHRRSAFTLISDVIQQTKSIRLR